jgi:hypothetical protein
MNFRLMKSYSIGLTSTEICKTPFGKAGAALNSFGVESTPTCLKALKIAAACCGARFVSRTLNTIPAGTVEISEISIKETVHGWNGRIIQVSLLVLSALICSSDECERQRMTKSK